MNISNCANSRILLDTPEQALEDLTDMSLKATQQ